MAKLRNFHFRVAFALSLLHLAHPVYGGCGDDQVGISDASKIPDDKITSSAGGDATSNTPARNGRLNYTAGSSWCVSSSQASPYLQVDLGKVYIICALATQGNSKADQWVKSYQIQYSTDAQKWSIYKEQNKDKMFYGNYDRNTVVNRFLYEGIQAQYIRVYPKTNHGGTCMRLELYGVTKEACSSLQIGVSKKDKVPDFRFSATSHYDGRYEPWNARLDGRYGWGPSSSDMTTSSLYIDLGNVHIVCSIKTQGFNSEWTTKYMISLSMDNTKWQLYQEEGKDKEFPGNVNYYGIKENKLKEIAEAKLIQMIPTAFYVHPTFRVEVYGSDQGCGSSLGLETTEIADSQLSASSGSAPAGRLYNTTTAWCGNAAESDYIQIQLNYFALVRGVATQGHPLLKHWTTLFAVKYSFDNQEWHNFFDDSQSWKEFETASNQSTVKVNWFKYPFVAFYVRIYPRHWSIKPCLRLDLYGCKYANFPKASVKFIGVTSVLKGDVKINLECQGRGTPEPHIKWKHGTVDISKQAKTRNSDGVILSTLSSPLLTSSCTRQSLLNRTMTCALPSYICQVAYSPRDGGAMVSSQSSTTVELDLPDAVIDLRTNGIQAQSANLIWTSPDPGHVPIVSYKFLYCIGGTQNYVNVTSSTNASTFVLSGLTPNTNYTLKIAAVSALGEGLQNGKLLHFTTKLAESNSEATRVTVIIASVVSSIVFVAVLLIVLIIVWNKRKKRNRADTSRQEAINLGKTSHSDVRDAPGEEENEQKNGIKKSENVSSIDFPYEPVAAKIINSENNDLDEEAVSDPETESGPLYGNVLNDAERRPIPLSQFSEFMTRVKADNFVKLKKQYLTLPEGKQFPSKEAEKPENKKLNRYANMAAYDHSRVMVEPTGGIAYINANYIEDWDGTPKTYIATQGPIPPTFPIFWLMVWNEQVSCIVMVTNVVENGKTKCHQYWPEKGSSSTSYGVMNVSLSKVEVFADFKIRTFRLTKDSESRSIVQFHFTVWPDHGVPRLPTSIVSLRRRVVSRRTSRTKGPILVHCSAGVGRTGAYIAIDAMLKRAKKKKDIDIYNYTQMMRKARISMIQTKEQYIFVYKAVLEALTCGNTEISAQDMRLSLKKLEAVDPHEGKTGFEEEFDRLITVCPNAGPDECEAAFRQENLNKNRRQQWVPLEISRVKLKQQKQKEGENYINASFADAYRERNAFILTQAPLHHTIEHFWKMVYDYSIGLVVMLNSLNEDGMSYPQYWPKEEASCNTYGDISVTVMSQEVQCSGTLIFRKLKVEDKKGRPKTVRHLQHTAWPDHSVPKNKQSVLDLITMVTAALQQSASNTLVVQCSDGVGRSGTFCAIYSILERVKLEQVVDVFQAVKALRVRRPGALENLEQYKFCYEIVQAFLDSFSDYSNFSVV